MKVILVVIASFLFSSFSFAGNTLPEITQLPSEWGGVGGDLFQRYAVKLNLEKINLSEGVQAKILKEYLVTGSFQFGDRKVSVTKFLVSTKMSPNKGAENLANNYHEMIIVTNDDLIPNIAVQISVDPKDGTLLMRELHVPGTGRRFILKAK